MVMMSWAGRPAWSGRSPVPAVGGRLLRRRRAAAVPGSGHPRRVRRRAGGPPVGSGWRPRPPDRSGTAVPPATRCRRATGSARRRRWVCCSRCSSGLGPSGSRWARIRWPSSRTVRGSDVRACSSRRRLHRSRVLGPLGSGNGLDRLGDRRRMLWTDLTSAEGLGSSRVHRLQDFTGQTAAGTEPLHRPRPLTRLHPGAAQLGGDQIRQPTKPQRARHIPRVQLGQHRQLPVPQPGKLGLQLPTEASSCASDAAPSCSITCSILSHRTAEDKIVRRR